MSRTNQIDLAIAVGLEANASLDDVLEAAKTKIDQLDAVKVWVMIKDKRYAVVAATSETRAATLAAECQPTGPWDENREGWTVFRGPLLLGGGFEPEATLLVGVAADELVAERQAV
ncbi:MAG: hypothetical protein ACPGVG_19420 [Mycobacterium sp.]